MIPQKGTSFFQIGVSFCRAYTPQSSWNDIFFTKMIPQKGTSFFQFCYSKAYYEKKVIYKNDTFFWGLRFFCCWDYNAHFEKRSLFGDVFKLGIIRRFFRNVPFLLKKVPFWNKKVYFLNFAKGTFFSPKHVLKSWRNSWKFFTLDKGVLRFIRSCHSVSLDRLPIPQKKNT